MLVFKAHRLVHYSTLGWSVITKKKKKKVRVMKKRFRGGLVFKAHRLLHHSTLGSRVIKKAQEAERIQAQEATLTSALQVL